MKSCLLKILKPFMKQIFLKLVRQIKYLISLIRKYRISHVWFGKLLCWRFSNQHSKSGCCGRCLHKLRIKYVEALWKMFPLGYFSLDTCGNFNVPRSVYTLVQTKYVHWAFDALTLLGIYYVFNIVNIFLEYAFKAMQ